jgi:hypothetical protein
MQYPSFAEYADALQLDLGVVLADPVLARGTLLKRASGLPVAHGGTFALTFEIETDHRKYALRCFHKRLDALHERYDAITKHLAGVKGPYLVACQFQPQGITTESGTYPVVRMDWVDGQSLAAFVAEHLQDSGALQQMRFSLRRLARHLRENGIAHGDIQPSNIVVQRGANLRLIDYDGMFVPALGPFCSTELGQRNFQHPGRRRRHFNASLDAFSFSVIDLALDALSRRPDLWLRTASGEDAFLLRAADFADPANSATFALLSREPGIERRVKHLAAICMEPFEQIPSFEDFVAARHVPALAVELSGDPDEAMRTPYVSPYPIVAAADFANCCKHIGDRVELIGRVVRVANATEPRSVARCLRVEFGAQFHDMTCLKVWPGSHSNRDATPDETWVGKWVSAVGLVEPVAQGPEAAQRQKHISISITEPFQLQRLTEAEALYRLRSQTERATATPDGIGSVRTDPVDPEPVVRRKPEVTKPAQVEVEPTQTVEPQPAMVTAPQKVRDVSRPQRIAPPPPKEQPPRDQRWAAWAALVVLAALLGYLLFVPGSDRQPEAPKTESAAKVPMAPAAEPQPAEEPTVIAAEVESKLVSSQPLKTTDLSFETIAGKLQIWPAVDDVRKRVLRVNDSVIADLRDDAIVLSHRAVFADREVITGFTQCAGSVPPCGRQQPFWLVLRKGSPPALRRAPELWVGANGGRISATNDGVAIDLGRWDGELRSAQLSQAGNIVVKRTTDTIRPLSRADCAIVAQALEGCAASRDCRSFARSAQRIPARQWTELTRMYHESTGLDLAIFRNLCVRSCELGLTPSFGLIRANACGGAKPRQWRPDDPAAGMRR